MSVGSVGGTPSTDSYCSNSVILTAFFQIGSSSRPSMSGGVSARVGRIVGRPASTPRGRAWAQASALIWESPAALKPWRGASARTAWLETTVVHTTRAHSADARPESLGTHRFLVT